MNIKKEKVVFLKRICIESWIPRKKNFEKNPCRKLELIALDQNYYLNNFKYIPKYFKYDSIVLFKFVKCIV